MEPNDSDGRVSLPVVAGDPNIAQFGDAFEFGECAGEVDQAEQLAVGEVLGGFDFFVRRIAEHGLTLGGSERNRSALHAVRVVLRVTNAS